MNIDELISKGIDYISVFIALTVVLSFHEFAHAFAAVKNGDVTPKLYGRYTLNPIAHFDLIGLVCFVFLHFGWAKPVPVNPQNFKNYKRGCFTVAIAGVLMNYLMAFVIYPLCRLAKLYVPDLLYFDDVLIISLFYMISMSLSFAVFNFLPFYPLDGFRVVDSLAKKRGKVYWFLRNYGTYVLYGLFALSIISDITGIWQLDVLELVMRPVINIISIPITAFWGLFF